MLLLLIDTFWGCQSSFAFILQGCLSVSSVHMSPPLRALTGLSASLIQSVFPQTHEQTCSWSPVLALTVQIFSVWQRSLSHSFSLQQRLCNKPKSIFLNLFPPRVLLWDVWLMCVWLPGFPHLPSWSFNLRMDKSFFFFLCDAYYWSELQLLGIHFP